MGIVWSFGIEHIVALVGALLAWHAGGVKLKHSWTSNDSLPDAALLHV